MLQKEKSLQLVARRRLQVVNCKPVTRQTCEKRKGESIMTRWNLARCEDNDEVRTFAKETLLRRKEEQPAVREQAKISLSANQRKIDHHSRLQTFRIRRKPKISR